MAEGNAPADVPEARVFVGDSTGRLKTLYTKSQRYEQVDIPGCRYGAAVACQELAYGTLTLVDGSKWPVVCIRGTRAGT